MAFRFLHTSDWQMGMKAAHVAEHADDVRKARLVAAGRVVDLANEQRVDALILAGDTFEDSDVPARLVQEVVDILRKSTAPVFVLPANHDPLVPRGIFEHPAWVDAASKVRVLRAAEPIELPGATLYPCPLRERTSVEDPTAWIPEKSGPLRIRVGVAHGSLLDAGAASEDIDGDFPIDRAVVMRGGLDYLALGHWHRPSRHEAGGAVRVAYSGSHEPTKFGEVAADGTRRSGECLVVTIDEPGAPPRLEAHRTAVLDWRQESVDLASAADLADLRRRIDGAGDAAREHTLVDWTLRGRLPMASARDLDEVILLAERRYLHVRFDRQGLVFDPGDDRWLADLPAGAPARAAARLAPLAAGTGRQAEVARRALAQLFALAKGGGR